MADSAMIGRPMIGVQPPLTSGMAIAAAEKPPSTSAPSAPIKVRPMRAGMAKARPVRMSGAERCSVFCMEKDEPKPPVQIRLKKVAGDLPSRRRKIEKSTADARQRAERDDDGLDHADRARVEAAALDRGRGDDGGHFLPPSPGFKAVMLLMPKPLCCRVTPGNTRRCDGRRQIDAARPGGQVMEPWTPSSR